MIQRITVPEQSWLFQKISGIRKYELEVAMKIQSWYEYDSDFAPNRATEKIYED